MLTWSWNQRIKKFLINIKERKRMNNQFLWFHMHYTKKHMLTYAFFTVFTLCLCLLHLNLLLTLSIILITILNYEIRINTKKFFTIEHQIIFSCPIRIKTLIKKIAMCTYIKTLFFLTLFFIFNFKDIWDIFIFCSFILVSYKFIILAYLLKFNERIRYHSLVLNIYFGVLYTVWYYMQTQSCLFIVSLNVVMYILICFISKKIKNFSFEKII